MTSRAVAACLVSAAVSGVLGWRVGVWSADPASPPSASRSSARPTELPAARPFGSAVIEGPCNVDEPSTAPAVASTLPSTGPGEASPSRSASQPSIASAESDGDQLQAMIAFTDTSPDGTGMQRVFESDAPDTLRLLAFQSMLGPLSGDPAALRQALVQGMGSTSAAVRSEARQRLDALNNDPAVDAAAGF